MSSLRLAIAASMASNVMPQREVDSKMSTSDSDSSDEEMEDIPLRKLSHNENQKGKKTSDQKENKATDDLAGGVVNYLPSSGEPALFTNIIRTPDEENIRSGQVTPPSPSTISKHIQPKRGRRIKVKFENNIWYGGTVEGFDSPNGVLHIKYDDGTHENTKFPDDDIVVESIFNQSYVSQNESPVRHQQTKKRPVVSDSSEDDSDNEGTLSSDSNNSLDYRFSNKRQKKVSSTREMKKQKNKTSKSDKNNLDSDDSNDGSSGDSETEFEANLTKNSNRNHPRKSPQSSPDQVRTKGGQDIGAAGATFKEEKVRDNLRRKQDPENTKDQDAKHMESAGTDKNSAAILSNSEQENDKRKTKQVQPTEHSGKVSSSIEENKPNLKDPESPPSDSRKDNYQKKIQPEMNDSKPASSSTDASRESSKPTIQQKKGNGKSTVDLSIEVPQLERHSSFSSVSESQETPRSQVDPDDLDALQDSLLKMPAEVQHRPSEHRPSLEYVFGGYDAQLEAKRASEVQEFQWVQCDACTKWRRVPNSVDLELLPEKWYCRMNKWDPNRASCAVPEDKEQDVHSPNPNSRSPLPTRPSANAAPAGKGGGGDRSPRRGYGRDAVTPRAERGTSGNRQFKTPTATAQLVSGPGSGSSSGGGRPGKRVHQWVQCERQECKKWRKLPVGYDMDQLPDKWFCSMNDWDPLRASCYAPEDTDDAAEEQEVKKDPAPPQRSRWDHKFFAGTQYFAKQGKMSYREMIFGSDGKLKVPYCEKGTNGRSLFGYCNPNHEEIFYRRNPEKYCSSSMYKDPHASRKNRFAGSLLAVSQHLAVQRKAGLGDLSQDQDYQEIILMCMSNEALSGSDIYSLVKSKTFIDDRLTSVQSNLSLSLVEKHLEFLVTANILQKSQSPLNNEIIDTFEKEPTASAKKNIFWYQKKSATLTSPLDAMPRKKSSKNLE
mmetsp:Transcript_31665/g.40598  ORF Transcript_31665/g.40598 Transcript_31665/m.40598 type:complete len:942 (-) Transcript_31665:111-2936(-)